MPEPAPQSFKPFNKLTGKEQAKALADPEYKQNFIDDVLTKNSVAMELSN
jgi:hypothetical protein